MTVSRLLVVCLLGVLPVPVAAADTLSLAPSPQRATEGAPIRVTYTGSLDGAAGLYATVFSYLQPGRTACARTQEQERNRISSAQVHMLVLRAPGSFRLRRPLAPVVPGLYRLCGYLQHHADEAHAPDAFATALVRVVHARG